MKNMFKRVLCLVLCLCAVLSMGACTENRTNDSDTDDNVKVEKVQFPLEEPVTFTFMIQGVESVEFKNAIANNALTKKLEAATNVHIEWQFIGNDTTKLSLLMSGGGYGDVIWGGPVLNSVTASKYIAAGKIQDLTPYITEDLMPEFSADLAENPKIMNMITAADGKVYTLPKITGLEGSYLESPIFINKAWLDKVGKDVPTTIDEFIDVLRAFRDGDPNGNGEADEIPYIACTSSAMGNLEALGGMFGIATKDGTNDSFVQVKDGKVTFVPATDTYKEYVKFLRQLYTEGLLWSECFTANSSTMNAKLKSETCLVGCYTLNTPLKTDYADDYICIRPPKVEGYEPCWYYHPAIDGSKNQFYVTDKCQNLSILMAYVDQFFNLENSVMAYYGPVGEGRVIMENGKYTFLELSSEEAASLGNTNPAYSGLVGNHIRSITSSDFANKINLSKEQKILQSNYELYKDILNDERWPRPYFATEVCNDADLYVTDINLTVGQRRANWITGRTDIDSDWDKFLSDLDACGLQEYMVILQDAYDACRSNTK